MASANEQPMKLSELFDNAWSQVCEIDDSELPTASKEYQTSLKDCMKLLITCTSMVNMLSLFSCNETIDEVSTPSLRYFLIPAFLGDLFQKVSSDDRLKCLRTALNYYRDFLCRCRDYEIVKKDLSNYLEDKEKLPSNFSNRDEKIQRYKENKQLKEKIGIIQRRLKQSSESVDECQFREHYMDWLKLYLNNTFDNIKSIYDEINLLETMKNMKLNQNIPKEEKNPKPQQQPMKPIVITRENLKNHVFGPGYKNLPTMSEEEYFQLEMQQGKIVQEYQSSSSKQHHEDGSKKSSDEDDDDVDSEEKLKKARAWDEWKDTHRRGEGNKERHG